MIEDEIKETVQHYKEQAERILNGESDNYDGADGARNVLELCSIAEEALRQNNILLKTLSNIK